MALEAPFFPQGVGQQGLAAAAGLAVGAVVGAHDGLDPGLPDQILEGGQVGLLHVLRACDGVELMAQRLRPAVHGEVLGAGGGLHGPALALQAAHIGLPHARGQIRVLAVGLMPAAPAGVAEDVDVRRPEGQAVVDVAVALRGQGVVLGPALGRGDVAELFEQGVVEHGGQTDGLGKAGGRAAARHAVQRLVPPVVGGHAQPLDRGRVVAELRRLFLEGHAGHKGLRFFSCRFAVHGFASCDSTEKNRANALCTVLFRMCSTVWDQPLTAPAMKLSWIFRLRKM